MKGVNEKNVEFDIGNKKFPLDEIASQEEYFVQIIVPEIDNPNQAVVLLMRRFCYICLIINIMKQC